MKIPEKAKPFLVAVGFMVLGMALLGLVFVARHAYVDHLRSDALLMLMQKQLEIQQQRQKLPALPPVEAPK